MNYWPGLIYIKGPLSGDALICVNPSQEGAMTNGFSGKGELSNFRSDNIYWDVCLNADGEVFIGNAYIVSFDVGIGVDPVPDQKVISGKKAMEPKPTKGNDTLFGWKTEDSAFFDFDTPITRNMTLTAAWAHPGVIPVDEKGTAKETLLDYHAVTEDVTSWSEDGWYCAPEDVTLGGRVNVTGKVDLLLRNGRTLTANGGIYVQGGGQLTVWAESTDDKTMGKLIAQGGESSAGIGGVESESHGAIVINGGHIEATGGRYGAGIGGGEKSSAGTVTINDGYVYTEGGKKGGAGIGSGNKGDFTGTVTIAGGTVLSNGGLIDGGAGIGAGFAGNASGGLVKITGGDVTAFSLGNKGAGIGGGNENWSDVGGEGGRVEIHGGKVMASAWGGGVYPVPDSFKNASAIGHGGTDKVNGDLVIMPGLKVRAGVNTANVNLKLYETHDAASACHERIAAVIEPCDHPNPTYVSVTSTGHTQSQCAYCGLDFTEAPHEWDDATHQCRLCGYPYDGELVNITFDANGGTGEMAAVTYMPEGIYTPPKCGFTPQAHRTFHGWEVVDRNGAPVESLASIHFPGEPFILPGSIDLVLRAIWDGNATITFDANGGSGDMAPVDSYKGEKYPLPRCDFDAPEWTHFVGWQVGDDAENLKKSPTRIDIAGDTVIKAIWKRKQRTVSFATDGGGVYLDAGTFDMSGGEIRENVGDNGGGVMARGTLRLSGNPVIADNRDNRATPRSNNVYLWIDRVIDVDGALTNAEKIGVRMRSPGVFTRGLDGKGSAASFRSDDAACAVGVNADGEAFLGEGITVTFDSNGGSDVPDQGVFSGERADVPGIPVREGFTFQGWQLNGVDYDFDTPVTEAITLVAAWKEDVEFGAPDFTLPADITRIEAHAFEGINAAVVYIPDGCREIEPYAFKDCANLKQIRIPEGCAVDEFAFEGCENLYVFGIPGDGAEQYCASHDNCKFVAE